MAGTPARWLTQRHRRNRRRDCRSPGRQPAFADPGAHAHRLWQPKKQDNFSSHGAPLGEDELLATKKALGWPSTEKFFIPPEALELFRTAVGRGAKAQQDWQSRFEAYRKDYPAEAAALEMMIAGKLPEDWAAGLPKWQLGDKAIATRVAGGLALNALAQRIPI